MLKIFSFNNKQPKTERQYTIEILNRNILNDYYKVVMISNKKILNDTQLEHLFDDTFISINHNQIQLSLQNMQSLLEIIIDNQITIKDPIIICSYKFCLFNNIAFCYQQIDDQNQVNFYMDLAHNELENMLSLTECSLHLEYIEKHRVIVQILKLFIKFKIQYCFLIIKARDQNYRKSVQLLFQIFQKIIKIIKLKIAQNIGNHYHKKWIQLQHLVIQGNTKITAQEHFQFRRSTKKSELDNNHDIFKKILVSHSKQKKNHKKNLYLGIKKQGKKTKIQDHKNIEIEKFLFNFRIENVIKVQPIHFNQILKFYYPVSLRSIGIQLIDMSILLSITQFTMSVVLRLTQIMVDDFANKKTKPSQLHLIYAIQILLKMIPEEYTKNFRYYNQLIKTYKQRYSNNNFVQISSIAEKIQEQDEQSHLYINKNTFSQKNIKEIDHLKTKKEKVKKIIGHKKQKQIKQKCIDQEKQKKKTFSRKDSILDMRSGKKTGTNSIKKKLKYAIFKENIIKDKKQDKTERSMMKAKSLEIIKKNNHSKLCNKAKINNEEDFLEPLLKNGIIMEKDKNGRYYSVGPSKKYLQKEKSDTAKKQKQLNKKYLKTINLVLKKSQSTKSLKNY